MQLAVFVVEDNAEIHENLSGEERAASITTTEQVSTAPSATTSAATAASCDGLSIVVVSAIA